MHAVYGSRRRARVGATGIGVRYREEAPDHAVPCVPRPRPLARCPPLRPLEPRCVGGCVGLPSCVSRRSPRSPSSMSVMTCCAV